MLAGLIEVALKKLRDGRERPCHAPSSAQFKSDHSCFNVGTDEVGLRLRWLVQLNVAGIAVPEIAGAPAVPLHLD